MRFRLDVGVINSNFPPFLLHLCLCVAIYVKEPVRLCMATSLPGGPVAGRPVLSPSRYLAEELATLRLGCHKLVGLLVGRNRNLGH
jgi:hypothetical protein